MHRFCRIEQLLGPAALEHLRAARVAVCGLGAVGSYAVEALARSGIGFLRLADCDVVRPSNFNRQLYALESNLDRPKTEAAQARVLDINPACEVDARQIFIDSQTAPELLAAPLSVVVDAIDSIAPKVALITAATRAGLPIISAMGAATRIDPFQIRVGDIAETSMCPLARFIRKKLRRAGIEGGVRCVYSTEPPRHSAAPTITEPETFARGRPRKPIGSLPYATAMFGLIAAYEAIKIIAPLEVEA